MSKASLVRSMVAGVCLMILAGGCRNVSNTYASTINLPLTLKAVDPASGQTFWSLEVPVQHEVVVDFKRPDDKGPFHRSEQDPTRLDWRLYAPGQRQPVQKQSVALPGTPMMLKVSYRPAPEYPHGQRPSPPAKPLPVLSNPQTRPGDGLK